MISLIGATYRDQSTFKFPHTNVSEDIPVHHEVAGHGHQEAAHGSVGELAILDGDL